jgi:large subunit ribosomal protein L6
MSRIGEEPVKIEEGIEVRIEGQNVIVKGPKGELTVTLSEVLKADMEGSSVKLSRTNEEKLTRSLQGTFRMLIANAIEGVKNGFEKKLEIVGVGYRVKTEGNTLVMNLGWNHPVKVEAPEGIDIEVPDETTIVVKGIDKQLVGEFAAKVRSIRKPEAYKGKGIRYEGEYIKIKTPKVVAKA